HLVVDLVPGDTREVEVTDKRWQKTLCAVARKHSLPRPPSSKRAADDPVQVRQQDLFDFLERSRETFASELYVGPHQVLEGPVARLELAPALDEAADPHQELVLLFGLTPRELLAGQEDVDVFGPEPLADQLQHPPDAMPGLSRLAFRTPAFDTLEPAQLCSANREDRPHVRDVELALPEMRKTTAARCSPVEGAARSQPGVREELLGSRARLVVEVPRRCTEQRRLLVELRRAESKRATLLPLLLGKARACRRRGSRRSGELPPELFLVRVVRLREQRADASAADGVRLEIACILPAGLREPREGL